MENTINGHSFYEKQGLTLSDLQENGEEKITGLSDDELKELKQQALVAEDYDIAKLIKQEQTERAERAKETGEGMKEEEDLQELEEQTRREEEWKLIQNEKEQFNEEKRDQINDLMSQLNDGDNNDLNGNLVASNVDSNQEASKKLNWLSDEDFRSSQQLILDVQQRRRRDDARTKSRFPTYIENINDWRKNSKNYDSKELYYSSVVSDIVDLYKDAYKDFADVLGGDSKEIDELYNIIIGLENLKKQMEGINMNESEEYKKLEEMIRFSKHRKEAIENYVNTDVSVDMNYNDRRHSNYRRRH